MINEGLFSDFKLFITKLSYNKRKKYTGAIKYRKLHFLNITIFNYLTPIKISFSCCTRQNYTIMRAVLNNCMDRSSSWEHSKPAGQDISVLLGTPNVITLFTSETCPEPHESGPRPHIVLLRLVLILYFYLYPDLPGDLIFSGFWVFYVIRCVASGFCHGVNGISARQLVVIYQRFGTTYRSQCLPLWRWDW